MHYSQLPWGYYNNPVMQKGKLKTKVQTQTSGSKVHFSVYPTVS